MLVAVIGGIPDLQACTMICGGRPATLAHEYAFLAKVISTETRRDADGFSYVVEPVRVWKGGWPGDATRFRLTTRGGGSCGYWMVVNAYYIVVATTEPQAIGECDHEPIPLSAGRHFIEGLDRAAGLRPLKLPREAFLSPSQVECPPSPEDARIDRGLEEAELVVVGRGAPRREEGSPNDLVVVDLDSRRALKGRLPAAIAVKVSRSYNAVVEGFPGELIWFLAPADPDGGRRLLQVHPLGSERTVASRLERRQVLGRGCPSPSAAPAR